MGTVPARDFTIVPLQPGYIAQKNPCPAGRNQRKPSGLSSGCHQAGLLMNSGVVVLSKSLPELCCLSCPWPQSRILVFSVGCYGTRGRGSPREVLNGGLHQFL